MPVFSVGSSTGRNWLEWSAGSLWSGGSYGPEGGLLTTVAVAGLAVLIPKLVPDVEETEEVAADERR